MKDTELYQALFGLQAPWRVSDVRVEHDSHTVIVRLDRDDNSTGTCPTCGAMCSIHDRRVRQWRHLDTMQYKTYLEADVPRVKCPEHGVRNESLPWAQPNGRFTQMFECMAISWLQHASVSSVSQMLDVDWKSLDTMMQRAVKRGLARRASAPLPVLCVDETSFQKRHEYVTIVSDGTNGSVLYVGDDRTGDTLRTFYQTLTPAQRDSIMSVNMDMWRPYIEATCSELVEGDTTICFDRFHISQATNKAVNEVRKQEHRQAQRDSQNSVLKGMRTSLLRNFDDLSAEQQLILNEVFDVAVDTAVAWSLKESARMLWKYTTFGWAERAWNKWIEAANATGLAPMQKVAAMIESHLWGILNAVVAGVSNARAEGINSKIKALKSRARGFRTRDRFRTAILFHCGNLDMSM